MSIGPFASMRKSLTLACCRTVSCVAASPWYCSRAAASSPSSTRPARASMLNVRNSRGLSSDSLLVSRTINLISGSSATVSAASPQHHSGWGARYLQSPTLVVAEVALVFPCSQRLVRPFHAPRKQDWGLDSPEEENALRHQQHRAPPCHILYELDWGLGSVAGYFLLVWSAVD